MAHFTTSDGIRLYYEDSGRGTPLVFVHEFAGDHRSWEPQVRCCSRLYRCVTFAARGYPPSDVPSAPGAYSQDRAREDVIELMNHLGIERAHIVGHSMGAYTTLHVGLRYPDRCRSLTAAGCGWGSAPAERAQSVALATDIAVMFQQEGIVAAAAKYADFAMRAPFKAKDPRGWREFARWMSEHSGEGHALTMLNVQLKRPTLWDMEVGLRRLAIPLLVIVGDEDAACLDGSIFLKRTVATAGLLVLPRAGHTINSEEPAAFNQALLELCSAADNGRWLAHRPAAA